MLRHEEPLRYDMTANLNVFLNHLHATRRFFTALETIRSSVNEVGLENITIAGHSLGASIALLAGQTLAYEGIFVDTHLFSPPFPSPPIERIKHRKVKLALNLTGVACATGLSHLLLDKGKMETSFRQFFSLRAWCPHLYVNPLDPICSSYISYFNTHEFMQRIGASSFAHMTAPVSLRGTLQQFFLNDCKPFHLVPCAILHVVNKRCAKLVRAHGLHQWWWPDIEVDYQKMSVIAGDMMSD
ncbi:hypothetical protein KP509_35G003400 [Ceratopteris richardii]|nr:hypothetical protein KP509_35G003400 [Ceratopteris richardii]